MSAQKILFGIEYTPSAIRVTTSLGHRSMITGQFSDAEQWLGHLFYGITIPSDSQVTGSIALPVNILKESGQAIQRSAKKFRFQRVLICSTCYAQAQGVPINSDLISVHVAPGVSSVGIVRRAGPNPEFEDYARPIAGREAREILVSLRCLLKSTRHEQQAVLKENVIVGGDASALESMGKERLEKELWTLGIVPRFLDDAHASAVGALDLARRLSI